MAIDPSLSRQTAQAIWDSIDPSATATGCLELTALHSLLSGKFGKDKSALKEQNANVIERVISKILSRAGGSSGGTGIKGLMK